MNLQGFYTNAGQALAAKVAAGTAPLTITRVLTGSGHTADIPSAASLPDIRQTLPAGEAQVSGTTATLLVTLVEVQAEQDYQLTELGVYAADPDMGEVLFQVYQLSAPIAVTSGGENVLRFYLRQSIGEQGISVTCSPAGLLTEQDLAPIRDTVFAASVPNRTVTVTASELQDYINSLPRLVSENLTISVSGTVEHGVKIEGFYGCGTLWLQQENESTAFTGGLIIERCSVCIVLKGLRFQNASEYDALLTAARTMNLQVNNCTFSGTSKTIDAVKVSSNSHVTLINCSISGCKTAVLAEYTAFVGIYNEATGCYSNNTTGAYVYGGSAVLLSGQTPNLLGASANSKNGGMIVTVSGSLL